MYSSESEKEQDLPTYSDSEEVVAAKPKTPKKARRAAEQNQPESRLTARDMLVRQDQLIAALHKMVALQEQMLKSKDELIATQNAEIERLRRMVRSLEIQ